jgi:hypothetical protein
MACATRIFFPAGYEYVKDATNTFRNDFLGSADAKPTAGSSPYPTVSLSVEATAPSSLGATDKQTSKAGGSLGAPAPNPTSTTKRASPSTSSAATWKYLDPIVPRSPAGTCINHLSNMQPVNDETCSGTSRVSLAVSPNNGGNVGTLYLFQQAGNGEPLCIDLPGYDPPNPGSVVQGFGCQLPQTGDNQEFFFRKIVIDGTYAIVQIVNMKSYQAGHDMCLVVQPVTVKVCAPESEDNSNQRWRVALA